MAEALTEYMYEAGIKVRYVHSDVDTLERIEIIRDLRLGLFDVLIGINLLKVLRVVNLIFIHQKMLKSLFQK